MEFDEAKKVLSGAVRSELRDHAFGDREVFWKVGDTIIAEGYFGSGECSVWFDGGDYKGSFDGSEARELSELGTTGVIDRNDMTGPDTYVEGQTMPGLTLEGVLKELTNG